MIFSYPISIGMNPKRTSDSGPMRNFASQTIYYYLTISWFTLKCLEIFQCYVAISYTYYFMRIDLSPSLVVLSSCHRYQNLDIPISVNSKLSMDGIDLDLRFRNNTAISMSHSTVCTVLQYEYHLPIGYSISIIIYYSELRSIKHSLPSFSQVSQL